MVICLERGADLHVAQLMPLPLTVSCFSKIQAGFTFLVPAHPGSPGQRVVKRVCVCGCLKIELVEDGVGADEPSYLATLAQSLATNSEQLISANSDVRGGDVDDGGGGGLTVSELEALAKGVSGLASTRSQFTETPCTYDEIHVRFSYFTTHRVYSDYVSVRGAFYGLVFSA